VSSKLALCSGTIQGSGIGPLLLVLYINELAALRYEYKVTVKFFADDLKLCAEISTDIDIQNFTSALNIVPVNGPMLGSCKSLYQSVVFYS